jgi:multidrug resistance efflux pump
MLVVVSSVMRQGTEKVRSPAGTRGSPEDSAKRPGEFQTPSGPCCGENQTMSVLTSHAYFQFARILAVLLFPVGACVLVFIEFEDRFVVSGIVESRKQVVVRSPLKETLVKTVLVEAGEDVAAEQKLLVFEDLHEYRHSLDQRVLRLKNLERENTALEPVGGQDLEEGRKQLQLQARMETLRLEIENYREKVERLTVRAPFAGRVTEVHVTEQDHVAVGTELFSLSSPEEKIIACMVPERHASYLHKGQRVHIKSNQFNYLRHDIYTGRVDTFSPYAVHSEGRVEYETEIVFETGRSKLPLGSTARCAVVVERQPLPMMFFSKK